MVASLSTFRKSERKHVNIHYLHPIKFYPKISFQMQAIQGEIGSLDLSYAVRYRH